MARYKTDLGIDGRFIYQDTEDYAFSQDSVFLANFADIKKKDRVIDLGCGNGILSVIIALKKQPLNIVCADNRQFACDLAEDNITVNRLNDKIKAVFSDVRDIEKKVGCGNFDKAVCNPPYFAKTLNIVPDKSGNNVLNNAECAQFNDAIQTNNLQNSAVSALNRALSRTECEATLEDFVNAANRVLRFGGEFTVIQKHSRLCDLLCMLRKRNLEPKHIIYIFPKAGKEIDTVIVRAKKGAKCGLTSETFTAMDANGNFTPQYNEMYGIN